MNKLTNEDFQADMELARSGTLSPRQVDDLIVKWGPRGGAFFGFLPTKTKATTNMRAVFADAAATHRRPGGFWG